MLHLNFYDNCLQSFELIKAKLITTPIMVAPDRELYFEIMCDASDFMVETILRRHRDKIFREIYYSSQTLDSA